MEIDRTVPWGFFDGAAQENLCGGGAIIFLSETRSFELMVGLWEVINNYVELLNLKLLLIFSPQRGCRTLNVCGDSMNVINWIKGIQICGNLRLANILSSIEAFLETYDSFSCRHVYRENNKEAEKASEEGLQLTIGQWKIRELLDGTIHEYYHRPFIEGVAQE